MSTKKTIQINPELFKIGGANNTSRNSRNKRTKEKETPIIAPSSLKNKLLSRIKEHKNAEIKANKSAFVKPRDKSKSVTPLETPITYSDEFYGALSYLSEVSKKKKSDDARRRMLNNRTLKNPTLSTNIVASQVQVTSPSPSSDLPISLELPADWNTAEVESTNQEVLKMNYKPAPELPYGCLKGGRKQTYREWKRMMQEPVHLPDIVRPPTPPKRQGSSASSSSSLEPASESDTIRQTRLAEIKNKIRAMQDEETQKKQAALEHFKALEQKIMLPNLNNEDDNDNDDTTTTTAVDLDKIIQSRHQPKPKNYIKKTIKRKFTLGKSDKLRKVAVLVTDKQTRKQILDTQKSLKQVDMNDVRKYLRQHGMIKVGSTCPPDILRKTFESAVLTGEVTNTNADTLLHNFMTGSASSQ